MRHWRAMSRIALILICCCTAPASEPDATTMLRTVCGDLYLELPDLTHCRPGRLTAAEEQIALAALNRIRHLHGLPPVILDDRFRNEARYAALIVAANRTMSHTPTPDTECYTVVGRKGSWESNLAFHLHTVWDPTRRGVRYSRRTEEVVQRLRRSRVSTPSILAGLLIDRNTPQLGHRRWMLDPYVYRVAFGRTDLVYRHERRWELATGAALHIIAGQKPAVAVPPRTLIAWPVGDYPADLFDSRAWFSLQVMVNGAGPAYSATVDYHRADVIVTDPVGRRLTVTDVTHDNDGYGLPNLIRWHVDGVRNGVTYRVQVRNVRIMRDTTSLQYSFRIIDSRTTGSTH